MYYITADSTGDYPEEFKFNNFYKLPMPYCVNSRHYMLGTADSLPLPDFYKEIKSGGVPSTSCVSPGTAIEYWTHTLKEGKDILHIGFSSALSSSFKNMTLAREELLKEFPDRKICLVDSLSASIGEAMLVNEAVINRNRGKSIEDNAKYLDRIKSDIYHYGIVDNLFHLKRGGRISNLKAIIGTAIQLKPIIKINERGELITSEKTISRKMALKRLLERVLEHINPNSDTAIITHADCFDDAVNLQSKILGKYPKIKIHITPTGHILLSHTGPGFLALAFKRRKDN
ncbi:MAG: DegV family protein [Christensenellales bacterium]|jgi:DegV family protein with EDD domain